MSRKALVSALALALAAPAGVALAHEDGNSFDAYFDHAQHQDYHEQEAIAHEQAHERGFSSPEEHEAWHRAAAEAHDQFHADHPETWHDHYPYAQSYYGGEYGGGYYGGYGTGYYPTYEYRQSYQYYRPHHRHYYYSYRY